MWRIKIYIRITCSCFGQNKFAKRNINKIMKNKIILFILLNSLTFTLIQGQSVKSLRSVNKGEFPEIRWYSGINLDTTDFSIYRTSMEANKFKLVNTLHGSDLKGDSLIYWVIDTTLSEKALYKYFITFPFTKDSVLRSEIMYGHNLGAIPSPQIVRFDAKPAKGKKAIDLNWELNYNFSVNTLSILRSRKYDDGYELIATLSGDANSYTDPVDVANEAYFYFIMINDYFGYQSPSVRIHGISTYKEKPLPPQSFKLSNEDNQAKMTWNRIGNNIVGYKVYRRLNSFGDFYPMSKMFYTPERDVSFVDSTVKGLKNKDIEYYVVSVSDGFVESSPSDTLTFHVQGDILKGAPQECDYVFDSLGRTMLIWTSQEIDNEVRGYNVYRSTSEGKMAKLNQQLIPYNINYFVDEDNTGTSENIYEIETVSITNTPSVTRAIARVNRQHMPQHLILSLNKTSKGILIQGVPLSGTNIKEIVLLKRVNSGDPKQVTKLKPDNIKYTDISVKHGEIYNYSAIAVLKDNTKETVNAGVVMRY
jgi:hypothetical protein